MFQTDMLHNLVRGLDPIHSKTIQLRPGQVFQGMITQLYPGQLAQLQLGNMSLSARLEAQLEKGNQYWFRVMPGEGIPRLKVLDNLPVQQTSGNQGSSNNQSILQQMGIQSNNANERVLQQLNQMSLPFTKGNIVDGGQLLQQSSLPQQQSLDIISSMIQRGFPLTIQTFQSLAALQSNQSLSDTMMQLETQLRMSPDQNGSDQQQLQKMLSNIISQTDPSRSSGTLHGVLQQLNGGDPVLQEQALRVARQAGIIPPNQPATEFFEQFKATIFKPENLEVVRQLWPQLFQGNQGGVPLQSMDARALFSYLMGTVRLDYPQASQQLLQLINPTANTTAVFDQLEQWLKSQPNDSSRALWTVSQNVRNDSFYLMNGTKEESPFRMFMQQLGLQHENDIRSGPIQDFNQRTQTLKAMLIQYLQQSQANSLMGRDHAEFLLQRLTGYQLVSSDHQGPIQHTLFQVPIKMADKYQDMTIQWEGRQTDDGSIDESHCRIIFYLNLELLEETVVDVQIQKRVITLTIFNENNKPKSVQEVWYPILKKKLEELNYQLSTIKWKQPSDQELANQSSPNINNLYRTNDSRYRGMDVRI